MHDHLRDLGRYIGEKESLHWLWHGTEELLQNLLDNFRVYEIDMVHKHCYEWPDSQSFKLLVVKQISVWLSNMSRLQLLRVKGNYMESIFSVAQSPQLLCLSPWLLWL